MLLSTLLLALPTGPAGALPPARLGLTDGLEWFEGGVPRALERAAETDGLVLVLVRTDWERSCERLVATVESEELAPALAGYTCLALDAESQEGALFAYEHRVALYPTLLLLEPDGALRDRLRGAFPAGPLAAHLERIRRNEGTLASLRAALAEEPGDLDLRYELSRRLTTAGDPEAAALEIDEIRRRDPEGTSRASLRIDFDAIHDQVFDDLVKWKEPDWAVLEQATEGMDDTVLRFKGLRMLGYAHDIEGVRARNAKRSDEVQPHLRASREYYTRALELVPEDQVYTFCNELAWNYYEDRANLTEDERAFALAAAQRAHEASPEDASILDTLACCYFMSGRVERALELNERCRELDPSRPEQWDKNEALFTGRTEDQGHGGN